MRRRRRRRKENMGEEGDEGRGKWKDIDKKRECNACGTRNKRR